MKSTISTSAVADQADTTMRLKLAATGACTPWQFDHAYSQWEQQADICPDRTLESVLVESGIISQEDWDTAAALELAPVEHELAAKHGDDLGIRGCLIALGHCDGGLFHEILTDWLAQVQLAAELDAVKPAGHTVNEVADYNFGAFAVRLNYLPANHVEDAAGLLRDMRANQCEVAFQAAQAGIDANIIIACTEACVPMEEVLELLARGRATVKAVNRYLLEAYLSFYNIGVDLGLPVRPVYRHIIEKTEPAFPAFDKMVEAGLPVHDIATAIVAGADKALLAKESHSLVDAKGDASAFATCVRSLLTDYLPEVGCENL